MIDVACVTSQEIFYLLERLEAAGESSFLISHLPDMAPTQLADYLQRKSVNQNIAGRGLKSLSANSMQPASFSGNVDSSVHLSSVTSIAHARCCTLERHAKDWNDLG